MKKTPALDAGLNYFGTGRALARATGLTPQAISYKIKNSVDLTAEQAHAVHRESGIPLSVLRPDLWSRRDK